MPTVEPFFKNLILENESPSTLYSTYLEQLKQSGIGWPTVYVSGALTSGGFRRDTALTFGQVIDKNGAFADLLRKGLYSSDILNDEEFVFYPGDTKSPEQWNQFDYNLFFTLMILGVENAEDAVNIESFVRSRIDMAGFVNKSLPQEERRKSYMQLLDLVDQFVKENHVKVHPVTRLIEMLDTDMSLGAKMEAEAARRFGAKIFRLQINPTANPDELQAQILEQIHQLKEIDSGFDFFGLGGPDNHFLYLIES